VRVPVDRTGCAADQSLHSVGTPRRRGQRAAMAEGTAELDAEGDDAATASSLWGCDAGVSDGVDEPCDRHLGAGAVLV